MHVGSVHLRLTGLLVIGLFSSLMACSGGGCGSARTAVINPTAASSSAEVSVSLVPAGPISLNASGTLWFNAAVTGSTNPAVFWDVDGAPNGSAAVGTITGSGNRARYNAPATAGTHTITATSVADSRKRGSATFTVRVGTCVPPPTSPLTVNVRNAPFHARGDGVADDTAAIQEAVNAVAGTGGTVQIPAGTYLVNPVANNKAGIRLGDNLTLKLDSGATLKALSTSSSSNRVLLLSGVQKVNITGGTIIGNRNNNTITDTDENGMGIQVANSRQVVVENMTIQDCWCDGVYVSDGSVDVTLNGVVADNNRRCGAAIVSVSGMVVRGCTFKGTTGMLENGVWANGCGVDVEPNLGETVENIQFLGNTFTQNTTAGLAFGPANANMATTFVTNCVIDGNTVSSNGDAVKGMFGICGSSTSGHLILNNLVTDNHGIGIYLYGDAANILVQGNTVSGTRASAYSRGYGILLEHTANITVQGNTVINNVSHDIREVDPTGSNKVTGTHPAVTVRTFRGWIKKILSLVS